MKRKLTISNKLEITIAVLIILTVVVFWATDRNAIFNILGSFVIATGFIIEKMKNKTNLFTKTLFFGTGFVLVLDLTIHLFNDIKDLLK